MKFENKIEISKWMPAKGKMERALVFMALNFMFAGCSSDPKIETGNNMRGVLDSLKIANDSLTSQFNTANYIVDNLHTQVSGLDAELANKNAQLNRLNKELREMSLKNKKLGAELKKAQKEKNEELDQLAVKERTDAERMEHLENEKQDLSQQLADLLVKYKSLKELGSVLHASNISLEPIHLKHNGTKEKKTKRARKMDLVRIHFDIDENRIADDGRKQLYLVIKKPDGSLLQNENYAGIINTSDGSKINYSVEKEIAVKKNEPIHNVTVDWKYAGEHTKGNYSIAIYNGGYKIGAGSVSMR